MTEGGILITGASAGIGEALAEHYAAPGAVLGLVARRAERLAAVAGRLSTRGARVLTYVMDVGDTAGMVDVTRRFETEAGGVSLAIANAGIGRSDDLLAGDPLPDTRVMQVNVAGVINTLQPLIPAMVNRGRGHLVAVGSVAGFRGMPGKGAYCASKAAVKTLMDAWRPTLRPHGIHVTTLCPGWIESELTAGNDYPMPFLMSAAKGAALMAGAIARGRTTYVFPWQMRLVVPLMKILPERLLPHYATRK